MIALDSSRNIIRDMSYIEQGLSDREFLVVDNIDNAEYHFEDYNSNNLIYLGELDLVYSIKDLEKGLIQYAPTRNGGFFAGPAIITLEIPQLEKLLKNKDIRKSYASEDIKKRDEYTCQLCGETDKRVLNVHHIVPRKSPFISERFIDSPLNQITLCANCHRVEHYVLEQGNDTERKDHVKRMLCINGFRWTERLQSGFYAPMEDIRKWNKIEIL